MEMPPFQFGLKAIFTAMTAAAVLLWVVGSLWLGTVESRGELALLGVGGYDAEMSRRFQTGTIA